MDFIFDLIKKIPALLFALVRFVFFLLLSLIVVPSMLVMLYLHKPWEKMLDSVFSVSPF